MARLISLVSLKEISDALNYSEEEILDMVRKKQIPHLIFEGTRLSFPLEEILGKFTPKPYPSSPLPKVGEEVFVSIKRKRNSKI